MTLWLKRTLALALFVGFAACSDDDDPTGVSLSAPTGLAATPASLTSIDLAWNAVTGATGYLLQRADPATPGTFNTIGGGVLAATNYTDNVNAGDTYGYRVAAVSGSDTSAFSAAISAATNLATLSGNITTSMTLTANTVWKLSGYVKVQNGATLTIEPGTRIIGDTAVLGSSLWILRGAKIVANGTAAAPIVFTSARSAGNRKAGDWGGIIIIGNGQINRTGVGILTEGGAAGEAVDYSGGTAAGTLNDSSGVLRYVRIEFAGFDVSNGGGQELNALSMYAVGRKTVLEYVQALMGLDDGFEWWGGGVDGRYLISYEMGDDHFDWSEGYQGRNQFLISFQSTRNPVVPGVGGPGSDPRGFEGDGCDPGVSGCSLTDNSASTPYSMPVFANFTMIGPGTTIAGYPTNSAGGVWRRGTGGTFMNGIIARYRGVGISITDRWTDSLFIASNGRDSLQISNILVTQSAQPFDSVHTPGGTSGFAISTNWPAPRLATMQTFPVTVLADTLLGFNLTGATLDFTPKAGSPATAGGGTLPAARVGGFFGGTMANTAYLGAGEPGGAKWWTGWTLYATN